MSYPDNWEVFGDEQYQSVTIAPRAALVQSQNGSVSIGYGVMVSHYQPDSDNIDLQRDTNALIQGLQRQNPALRRAGEQQGVRVANTQAILTRFTNESPFRGTREIDNLLTVPRPDGLFYAIFIAPEADAAQANAAFQQMIRSLRFAR